MLLITTGGRDYDLVKQDYQLLYTLNPTYLYVGDCPTGADDDVWAWAVATLDESHRKQFIANWSQFARAGGPIRNQDMLDAAAKMVNQRLLLLAFPGGLGTRDCITRAKRMGIPCIQSINL